MVLHMHSGQGIILELEGAIMYKISLIKNKIHLSSCLIPETGETTRKQMEWIPAYNKLLVINNKSPVD